MTPPETSISFLSLKIPSDFKSESIEILNQINDKARYPIHDIYGSIPDFLPSSRAAHCLPKIDIAMLGDYLKLCLNQGYTFHYTVNAINGINCSDLKQLDQLLEAGVKRFTVATLDLAKHLKESGIIADISVVANLNTPEQLQHFLQQLDGPVGNVCLPEQLNRNHTALKQFTKTFPDISFELIVNSFCYQNCPHLQDHYRFICTTQANQNDPLESWCTQKKMTAPFDQQLSYISPAQLDHIANLGISKAKLAGRELITDASYDVIAAWASGDYKGNGNKLLLLGTENWYQHFPDWTI